MTQFNSGDVDHGRSSEQYSNVSRRISEFHIRIKHGSSPSAIDYYRPDIEMFIRAADQVEARARTERRYSPDQYSICGIDQVR